ncbi:hypothetical protein [Myxococcus stipitatus]|uniref:hypothetical protein n=1 Tax=Myxococcus stipitatus TaxID=83455 RepID=UPI0030D4961D
MMTNPYLPTMPTKSPMLRRTLSVLPLAMALSLTACGDELDPERVPPESVWVTDRIGSNQVLMTQSYDLIPRGYLVMRTENEPWLMACATRAPNGSIGADGDSTACINLVLEKGLLASGPKQLKLAGRNDISDDPRTSVFTPDPGHSAEIKAAYASVSCDRADPTPENTQQVSGRLVLDENSDTRLRGHVVVTSIGKTIGGCFGNKTEANLSFDIAR